MSDVLPRIATPLPVEEMAAQFVRGYENATGHAPRSRTLLYNALAIIGVENGNGRFFIHHNWGNIMAGPGWTRDKWPHPRPAADQPAFFRAYPSHAAGCAAWWRLMYSGHRAVLELAAQGRTRAMIAELYSKGYVVGPESQAHAYQDTAERLVKQYRADGLFRSQWPLASDWVPVAAMAASVAGIITIGVVQNAR